MVELIDSNRLIPLFGVTNTTSIWKIMHRHKIKGFKIREGSKFINKWHKSDVGKALVMSRKKPCENDKELANFYWECISAFGENKSNNNIESTCLAKMKHHEGWKFRDIKRSFAEIGIVFELVENNGYAVGIEVRDRV